MEFPQKFRSAQTSGCPVCFTGPVRMMEGVQTSFNALALYN